MDKFELLRINEQNLRIETPFPVGRLTFAYFIHQIFPELKNPESKNDSKKNLQKRMEM